MDKRQKLETINHALSELNRLYYDDGFRKARRDFERLSNARAELIDLLYRIDKRR